MKIAIIGLGPAGIFALALLPPAVLKDTIVFEPSAIGGDLATKYAPIHANIPKSQIVAAFRSIPCWAAEEFTHLAPYEDDACPPLGVVAKQLRHLATPLLKQVTFHASKVTQIKYTAIAPASPASQASWTIESSDKLFEVQNIFLCTGAEPKVMNLPLPTIPLPIALNPALLSAHVSPDDSVVVFGTAHSGTLVLKHLHDADVSKVAAVYKGSAPFVYARDGASEGIKAESATIADAITAGSWGSKTPRLISYDDFAAVYRAIYESTAAIYACGFNKGIATVLKDGVSHTYAHDGTCFVDAPPGLYGFGVGFPSFYTSAEGSRYPDIGFAGFIAALRPIVCRFGDF